MRLGIMQPTGFGLSRVANVGRHPVIPDTSRGKSRHRSAVIATWSRLDCCCMLTALIGWIVFCDNLLYDAVRSGLVAMILQRFSQLLVV